MFSVYLPATDGTWLIAITVAAGNATAAYELAMDLTGQRVAGGCTVAVGPVSRPAKAHRLGAPPVMSLRS